MFDQKKLARFLFVSAACLAFLYLDSQVKAYDAELERQCQEVKKKYGI